MRIGGFVDILLVDDSKVMRSLVQRAIRQAGYRNLDVVEAENGLSALEKLEGGKPRLILSDWNMPEMSGFEFLTKVREIYSWVPFGFITSESSLAVLDKARRAGANFILSKPFTVEDVQGALATVLGG
jgi:two-component system chemotaxis response regulator CheY